MRLNHPPLRKWRTISIKKGHLEAQRLAVFARPPGAQGRTSSSVLAFAAFGEVGGETPQPRGCISGADGSGYPAGAMGL